jgi:transcriptional regulator with XRE-family HTH domain
MLGDRIKEARKAKNLTQKQLADIIGAKHSSISDWENNLHRPDINLIPLLSEALSVPGSWLLEEDLSAPNPAIRNYLTSDINELPEEAKKEIDTFIEFVKAKYKSK